MRYEILSGDTLEFPDPPSDVAAFLVRVQAAAYDPRVSLQDIEVLVYGEDNPLLDHERQPGRHVVLPATMTNPVYHVLLDMIGRKREAVGALNMDAARARHTMKVSAAAAQLGITEAAIRQRIASGRLSAIRVGSTYLLDPQVVAAQRVLRRGPAPKAARAAAPSILHAHTGKGGGASLRVVHDGLAHDSQVSDDPSRRVIDIEGWERAGVVTGVGDKTRFFLLAPASGEERSIKVGSFEVRGAFRVVSQENNAKKAQGAFAALKKEIRAPRD